MKLQNLVLAGFLLAASEIYAQEPVVKERYRKPPFGKPEKVSETRIYLDTRTIEINFCLRKPTFLESFLPIANSDKSDKIISRIKSVLEQKLDAALKPEIDSYISWLNQNKKYFAACRDASITLQLVPAKTKNPKEPAAKCIAYITHKNKRVSTITKSQDFYTAYEEFLTSDD